MPHRFTIHAIIGIAALVWAVGLTIDGVAVDIGWGRWFTAAVGIAVLALLAFDRWAWAQWPVSRIVSRPDLRGTWKGEIRSGWTDASGESPPPIKAFLVIRQTFSIISIRAITKESSSDSLVAVLQATASGEHHMTYTYMNVPELLIQDRSRIHHGTASLDIHDAPGGIVLRGSYWTDRDTKGQMEFTNRKKRRYTDFASAAVAFERDAQHAM